MNSRDWVDFACGYSGKYSGNDAELILFLGEIRGEDNYLPAALGGVPVEMDHQDGQIRRR